MARKYDALTDEHRAFIARQQLFFTATAADIGHVNLSPKGLNALRIPDERTALYLDLTGSGNETAAHLLEDGRLTIMLCAFEGQPRILRMYGRGRVIRRGSAEYDRLLSAHFEGREPPGARQIIALDIELVQTSCGYGVPRYRYEGEREHLVNWAAARGEVGMEDYRRRNNRYSMDDLPTGLLDEPEPA